MNSSAADIPFSHAQTLPIGLLGVGSHCRREHIPALKAALSSSYPQFHLKAICDHDLPSAQSIAGKTAAKAVYSDLHEMLRREELAGLIAVTPTTATAKVATCVMQAGIPLLMEKPLGTCISEADYVVSQYRETGAQVMVGLNRRFDPVLRETKNWIRNRPVRSFLVQLHRSGRTEEDFCTDVLPHPLDFLQSVLGPLRLKEVIPHGTGWGHAFTAILKAGNHAQGVLQCLPHSCRWREEYAFAGPGFQIRAYSLDQCCGYAEGESPFSFNRGHGIDGSATYHETCAFLRGLLEGRLPGPSPAEVIDSMRLAQTIQDSLHP